MSGCPQEVGIGGVDNKQTMGRARQKSSSSVSGYPTGYLWRQPVPAQPPGTPVVPHRQLKAQHGDPWRARELQLCLCQGRLVWCASRVC